MSPNHHSSARTVRSIVMGAAAILLIGGALVAGNCGKKPLDGKWPKLDPTAKPAKITLSGGGYVVAPPILHLSLKNRDRAQWFNGSDSTVTVVLVGSPLVFEIEPGGYSQAFRVNPRADTMRYDYKVFGPAGDAPQPPQIEVGP